MAKRKKRSKRKSSKRSLKYPILTILVALFTFIGVALGLYLYHLGFEQGREAAQKSSLAPVKRKEHEALKKILQKPSEVADYLANESASASAPSSASSGSRPKLVHKKRHEQRVKKPNKKPKLVIIIDDVAFGWQVRALKSLHMPINLSFFPPTPRHPNTPRYARSLRHYMIHLPMEATHFRHEEKDTLRVDSSWDSIEKVIRRIREQFPRAKFINNHTGSRFTSDYAAMKRLLAVLDRYGFTFVDSRTTPKTQVPSLMRQMGRRYLARDIFLDNEQNLTYIQRQLKKAISKAKRRGYAIAIGHPHKTTIEALRRSQNLLKDVELIYIENLKM